MVQFGLKKAHNNNEKKKRKKDRVIIYKYNGAALRIFDCFKFFIFTRNSSCDIIIKKYSAVPVITYYTFYIACNVFL